MPRSITQEQYEIYTFQSKQFRSTPNSFFFISKANRSTTFPVGVHDQNAVVRVLFLMALETNKKWSTDQNKIMQQYRWTQGFTWKTQTGKPRIEFGARKGLHYVVISKKVQDTRHTRLRQLPSYTAHTHPPSTNLTLELSSSKKEKISSTRNTLISQEKTSGTLFFWLLTYSPQQGACLFIGLSEPSRSSS